MPRINLHFNSKRYQNTKQWLKASVETKPSLGPAMTGQRQAFIPGLFYLINIWYSPNKYLDAYPVAGTVLGTRNSGWNRWSLCSYKTFFLLINDIQTNMYGPTVISVVKKKKKRKSEIKAVLSVSFQKPHVAIYFQQNLKFSFSDTQGTS